jgi:hypothetical protein
MAESKLTDQTTLTTPADGDWAYLVDISDTSGGALGTSKKITVANLMTKAPVISVNGEVGAVSLDSTEIKRVGTTGDSIDQDLTAAENSINEIKAVLKYPSATVAGLQVNATNKLELDSTNQKAVFTINGTTAATIGPSQSLFPALKVGPTANDYTLPVARGVTGNVAVYDDATHTSEWRSLATGNLSGTSDGITQGTTNLFLTSAERTKLTSVTSGAAVASVSGTAPIVSSGGTTPAISITAATTLAAGSMSASDKSKLDGITAGAAVASVTGTAPIVSSGGTTPAISITAATTSAAGSMSAADKTKLDGIAAGAQVNQSAFSNFAVATQTTVAADTTTDTVTFAQAGGMTITTNATTDTITFDSARLDDDDVTLAGNRTINTDGNDLIIENTTANKLIEIQPDAVITAGLSVRSVNGTTAGAITLFEATNNGGFGLTLTAPAQLTASTTFTLPSADGTNGQVVQTNGSGVMSFVTKKHTQVTGKTVATGAWSLVSGVYEASISDAAILATSIVDVIPNNADASTIRTAGLLPRTDSSSGAVKIYATSAPAATITVTLNIFDL